jgi:ketosteroid isomerase-like protein
VTTEVHSNSETILALERAALDRWNSGDVDGQLEHYSEDVTYFDPLVEVRIDGRARVAAYFREFFAGKINIPRCELLNPQVIVSDELAVLTYNLLNYVRGADGAEKAGTRWNSTQVYRRVNGQWRVVHVNWSFTRHPAAMQSLME